MLVRKESVETVETETGHVLSTGSVLAAIANAGQNETRVAAACAQPGPGHQAEGDRCREQARGWLPRIKDRGTREGNWSTDLSDWACWTTGRWATSKGGSRRWRRSLGS